MLFSILIYAMPALAILLIGAYYYAQTRTIHNTSNHPNILPKKYIILWDIHGVLFEKSIFTWLRVIVAYPHLFTVCKKLDTHTIALLLKYCGKKIGLLKEEITNQELINYAQKIGNHPLVDLTTRVSCAYKPKYKTIHLVKQLHEHGYIQHIGSNIGKHIFDLFAPEHPTIFSYFSAIHIIDTSALTTKIKKPNKEFFLNYIETHKKNPEDILFIDDRLANVTAARNCGLHAIHFKNSIQLQKELESLGLFQKKNDLL